MLKAYKISCVDCDHGEVIVFASCARNVSRYYGRDLCSCEWIDRSVRRAPAFDKYAPGPVTVEQYLAEGWWWRCAGCSNHVTSDDDFRLAGEHVFCSKSCLIATCERERAADKTHWHESMYKFLADLEAATES